MGWIIKTAPNEPGDGILASESGPHTHTPTHGTQTAGEEWRVAERGWLFSDVVSFDV